MHHTPGKFHGAAADRAVHGPSQDLHRQDQQKGVAGTDAAGGPRVNEAYRRLLDRLVIGLKLLPDKPEESPDSTLRALWHTAAGDPRSAVAALHDELPELRADGPSLQILEHFV